MALEHSQEIQENNDEQLTLYSITKRLFNLYRPYFGLDSKNLKRTLLASGIVFGNVLLAFALTFVNVSMASLMGLLMVPGVTYTAFFWAAGQCTAAIVSYGVITGVDAWMASLLGSSLSHAINKKLESRWLKNGAYYGTKLTSKNAPNPAQLLSHDNNELNQTVAELFDNYLTTISNFIVGMIGLYALSVPLQITFFSFSFALPGYLVLSTIIYAIVYNSLTNKMGDKLEDLQTTERDLEGKVQTKVHHIKTHAEAIAFKRGADYEHDSLMQTIKQSKVVQKGSAKVRSLLNFITNLHAEFTSFFAILLCGPNLVSGRLPYSSILEIPYHFQNGVNQFTWKSDNFEKVTKCAVTLKNIEDFNEEMDRWDQIQKQSQQNLKFTKGCDQEIALKKLTLRRPDGSAILTNYSKTIPRGKRTLLAGASGAGKTSILRTMAGLSPYATGEIQGLTGKKVIFISSHPYFPEGKCLLDAIMYPKKELATSNEIKKVTTLMKELNFKEETIKALKVVKDWNGPHLSDGEKQRIEIIGAIMKEPEIIIMDEATSRVDHDVKTDNKGNIERVIQKYLPSTDVLYTDHNPTAAGKFYNNKIYLSAAKTTPTR